MKYRELVQFEPILSVVQLREADDRAKAQQLVKTSVLSDRMADVIVHQIMPILDLQLSERAGGLFIVGKRHRQISPYVGTLRDGRTRGYATAPHPRRCS